jgi:hypothetical protein
MESVKAEKIAAEKLKVAAEKLMVK